MPSDPGPSGTAHPGLSAALATSSPRTPPTSPFYFTRILSRGGGRVSLPKPLPGPYLTASLPDISPWPVHQHPDTSSSLSPTPHLPPSQIPTLGDSPTVHSAARARTEVPSLTPEPVTSLLPVQPPASLPRSSSHLHSHDLTQIQPIRPFSGLLLSACCVSSSMGGAGHQHLSLDS